MTTRNTPAQPFSMAPHRITSGGKTTYKPPNNPPTKPDPFSTTIAAPPFCLTLYGFVGPYARRSSLWQSNLLTRSGIRRRQKNQRRMKNTHTPLANKTQRGTTTTTTAAERALQVNRTENGKNDTNGDYTPATEADCRNWTMDDDDDDVLAPG